MSLNADGILANVYTDAPVEPDIIARFAVRGEPISKARSRFTNKGGKTRSYTPERTRDGEKAVAVAFRKEAPNHNADSTNAYAVDAVFYNGTRQRRDVDNMLKLILDGLNGIAWHDDNQVTEVTGRKILTTAEKARTVVTITRLGLVDRRVVDCVRCGKEYASYPSQEKRKYCTIDCYHEGLKEKRARECEQCGITYHPRPGAKTRFCSVACRSAASRRIVTCTHCGVDFTKQACHVTQKNYCSGVCQQAHVRPIRGDRARGVCATCGGPTSKRTYTNCQSCAFPNAKGKPLPITEATN